MSSFKASDANYVNLAHAFRSRYTTCYSPVALHRRRCRHQDRNRTHRTITIDETLWDLALVAKNHHNAMGGTVCVNLSSVLEEALCSWLIADMKVPEEWIDYPGRLPADWQADMAAIERKREQRGKQGQKRPKKLKGIPSDVPASFRSSEGDAAWFFSLQSWCNARNLMLLDVKKGRPMVQLGLKAPPFYLDTQPFRYSGWPQRSLFL